MGTSIAHLFSPSTDASRCEDAYEITIELPGVKSADVDVTVEANMLAVKGEKRSERTEESKTYFLAERRYGAFQRAFQLPNDVDVTAIDATFDDGVLKITLPKLQSSKVEEHRIEIRKR